jgi:peptidoglycan/LPS O-acetylase OafA/YrhL
MKWREGSAGDMHERLKNYALVLCLFVFMFVIIGGGLHLNPGGALLAAVTGTPLVIHAFRSRPGQAHSPTSKPPDLAKNEVSYVGNTTDKSD